MSNDNDDYYETGTRGGELASMKTDQKIEKVIPGLAQAFAAFNRSADKLSTVYGRLAGAAPEYEFQPPTSENHVLSLLLGALECVPGGVVVVDHEGSIVAFNEAAQQLAGFDENYMDILKGSLTSGKPGYSRQRLSSDAEVEIYTTPVMNSHGDILGVVGVLGQRDTPIRQRALPASPRQPVAPMLTAIGDIIINIAQQMRSPLSAIQLFAELLRQDLDADRQETVDDILVSVHSLDAVLSNLLSFSQPAKPNFQKVDIVSVLDESLLFAEPVINQQAISLIKEYSHNELYCHGDLEQLRQVCFNLILNAIQAMPTGGELRINASYAYEDKYACIDIEDNGCGIDDEAIDRVFIPFFTTKEGGAGLGLCVVYRVIQAHQGTIQISSNYGHGTIVSMQLPAEQD